MDLLIKNKNRLVIVYGFDDTYINGMLEMYLQIHEHDKKMTIVDKLIDEDRWERGVVEYGNPLEPGPFATFVSRMLGKDFWCCSRTYPAAGRISDDKCMLYLKGFREYCADSEGWF